MRCVVAVVGPGQLGVLKAGAGAASEVDGSSNGSGRCRAGVCGDAAGGSAVVSAVACGMVVVGVILLSASSRQLVLGA